MTFIFLGKYKVCDILRAALLRFHSLTAPRVQHLLKSSKCPLMLINAQHKSNTESKVKANEKQKKTKQKKKLESLRLMLACLPYTVLQHQIHTA